MSTRSIIAVPAGGSWRGRYCHSDGYPSHQLRQLLALVARDGLEQVRTTLTETHSGWSYIEADRVDLPSEWREGDERYAEVPGYGLAYTTKVVALPGNPQYQQISEDEWFSFEEPAESDAEWGYVLDSRNILIYTNDGTTWTLRGRVGYDEQPSAERVRVIECGERFEYCSHMAWAHFPEAEGTHVCAQTWIGIEEPGHHEIRELVVNATGVRIKLNGSGGLGTARDLWDFRSREWPRPGSRYWWSNTSDGDVVRAFRCLKAGYKLAPTYTGIVQTSAGERLIPAGTVLQ